MSTSSWLVVNGYRSGLVLRHWMTHPLTSYELDTGCCGFFEVEFANEATTPPGSPSGSSSGCLRLGIALVEHRGA